MTKPYTNPFALLSTNHDPDYRCQSPTCPTCVPVEDN